MRVSSRTGRCKSGVLAAIQQHGRQKSAYPPTRLRLCIRASVTTWAGTDPVEARQTSFLECGQAP